jgi:hypothetical protein
MTRDKILALCNKARDVGSVKHADFIDYVVVLEGRRKVHGEWQTTEHAYMTIDGKLAMANLDHCQQNKRLDFGEPKVLVDSPEQLTLQVTVTSEVYGVRHGIATSRKKTGTNAEKDRPWEVVETSATGRALAAMGYGLLPGAGLASADAERMLRAAGSNSPGEQKLTNHNGNGNGNPVCATHRVAMEHTAKGWAHRLKGGGLCYGPRNGSTLAPVAPGNHSAVAKSA